MNKEWMSVVPIHFNLPSKRKIGNKWFSTLHAWSDILHTIEDLGGIVPWFLLAKLVTRKGQDMEVGPFVVLDESVQCVVLRGVASEGGHIDHQQHTPQVVGNQDVSLSVDVLYHKVGSPVDIGGLSSNAVFVQYTLVLFEPAFGTGQ